MSISFICLLTGLTAAADFPRPELLVEAAALAKNSAGLVLDVRPREQYLQGHIPAAVSVDAAAWSKAFNAEPSAEAWSRRLGETGIGLDSHVVVYGEDVRDAARVWWILRYWGVKDVRLLNGGLAAWKAAEGKLVKDETRPDPVDVKLTAHRDRLATKDELVRSLKDKPPQIIDARSSGEFCGDATTAKRNGAVPGAIHLEWTECLDPKTKQFRKASELEALLRERKIDVDKPAVTYCQSGGRAAVVAFTLELMGGKQVRNYYRSWSEWGNDPDTPIAKPKK
jgi:thiosulfate/3-mercaptopyruvate sulfurtransferase